MRLKLRDPKKKSLFFNKIMRTPHTANKTKELIKEFNWEVLDHPPYSPDLATSDYYLFSPLKNYLTGIRYPNQEELEFVVRDWFQKQDVNFFRKVLKNYQKDGN